MRKDKLSYTLSKTEYNVIQILDKGIYPESEKQEIEKALRDTNIPIVYYQSEQKIVLNGKTIQLKK